MKNILKAYKNIPNEIIVKNMPKELIELHERLLLIEAIPKECPSNAEMIRKIRIEELKRKLK